MRRRAGGLHHGGGAPRTHRAHCAHCAPSRQPTARPARRTTNAGLFIDLWGRPWWRPRRGLEAGERHAKSAPASRQTHTKHEAPSGAAKWAPRAKEQPIWVSRGAQWSPSEQVGWHGPLVVILLPAGCLWAPSDNLDGHRAAATKRGLTVTRVGESRRLNKQTSPERKQPYQFAYLVSAACCCCRRRRCGRPAAAPGTSTSGFCNIARQTQSAPSVLE